MSRDRSLPIDSTFENEEAYVASLLSFATSSDLFMTLCGGVHILDWLTSGRDVYASLLPLDWRIWMDDYDVGEIIHLLIRADLYLYENNGAISLEQSKLPPSSLLEYIKSIRVHSLQRNVGTDIQNGEFSKSHSSNREETLSPRISTGMKPKKIHEVSRFARYVNDLSYSVSARAGLEITHLVDFGAGQSYLGRALASEPYSKQVVAVEGRPRNVEGAKVKDVTAKLSQKAKVPRNKKAFRQDYDSSNAEMAAGTLGPAKSSLLDVTALEIPEISNGRKEAANGQIYHVEHYIENGDLSSVVSQIPSYSIAHSSHSNDSKDLSLMVISLHSCGNLIHHGIRSLILNDSVKAVALIGCCYNLATERLGPSFKLPSLRNASERVDRCSSAYDPHGFPMSEHFLKYPHSYGNGIRLNITARMMAVQAPGNWTEQECNSFFTRHFFRALLQRIFWDRGLVSSPDSEADDGEKPAIIIGSLRKACYDSFVTYVRGALLKLKTMSTRGKGIAEALDEITDEEINSYERKFEDQKKKLSIVWTLMAFSAGVVESLIVLDRWQFLKEHPNEVRECWVEPVFDYFMSPRNLVIVGIKR